jgi:octaprenyl-diphosphate synthase
MFYYEISEKKTATLIAACCALGAKSVIEDEIQVENMRKFGELIGMAFQIKDDLFDYTDEAIGKPTGMILKNKMTLPLIYVLNTCIQKEKNWFNSIKITIKIKKTRQSYCICKDNNGLLYAGKNGSISAEALLLLIIIPIRSLKKLNFDGKLRY